MIKKLRPKIGLLPTGHKIYWGQFPGLKSRGTAMYNKLYSKLETIGDIFSVELVDTAEKAHESAELFRTADIDILLIFPLGYTTGMCIVPIVKAIDKPIRILNAHEDASYDYKNSDTEFYLHHEGVCCIPEYSSALVSLGKKFKVHTGHFGQERFWKEIESDCIGAAAANKFKQLRFGVIGNTYTNMVDMPVDEGRLMRATGKMFVRPEVEEIVNAFDAVTDAETKQMLKQFRQMYEVEESVTDDHLKLSAQIAVAFEKVILKHDISAFGYYWWGDSEKITQLRAQSALAVSRLASMGRPGVTEGDIKTAMAMKIHDLLGAGGMFVEFFCMDFKDDFIIVGHDGPSNINVAMNKPVLKHLDVHHGKTGHGIGIDFDVRPGPVTLLNMTENDAEQTYKLIYTVAEVIPGEVLRIGNPNCRLKLKKPIHQFIDDWCQQGPVHHSSLGLGDCSAEIETFAEAMKFKCVRI